MDRGKLTNSEPQDVAARIAELEELSAFLYDLAIARPEYVEMLFRLSDKASAEANRLKRHFATAI